MFRISYNITIGKYRYPQVAGVVTERSMDSLTATCDITLPKRISFNGTEASQLIQKDDPVTVEAGYDDNNNVLFTGYVRSVKTGVPLVVHCEDEMYKIKQVTVKTRTYPSLTLKALLDEYLPLSIDYEINDVNLGEFRVSGDPSLAKVLDTIKSEYALNFFFRNGNLYGTLPGTMLLQQSISRMKVIDFSKYIKEDRLVYEPVDDVKLIIKVKTILPDNTKLEVQEPEDATDGEVHTFLALDKTTEQELRAYAKELLLKYKPGDLKGNIVLYGRPYIEVGDFIKLLDSENENRNGKICEVRKITYKLGDAYLEQDIEIGRTQ